MLVWLGMLCNYRFNGCKNVSHLGSARNYACKNVNCNPHTTNSPYTNYWSALYSPTLPPSGAIHHLLTTVNSKFSNLNVLESLVTILDAPLITHLHTALNLEPIHEFIYRLTNKIFCSCPTHPNPLFREIGKHFTWSPQAVQEIYIQTYRASPAVTPRRAAAVFFSL
jgi:hypothetical protein